MTRDEAQKVGHGLYRIFWTGDDHRPGEAYSLAAVGSDEAGRRWFAATNWIRAPWFDWSDVLRVERIEDGVEEPAGQGEDGAAVATLDDALASRMLGSDELAAAMGFPRSDGTTTGMRDALEGSGR